ncbi:MAG: potassium-tellurite ethidium and proflavin transporter [Methanomassiliicoccales archaeon PtaU1.Bin124]|nr:MAG: potassium-tellurite ethidium and proflavin transporter [Methanomassiliicoccales archaeon PtaU1.Bin124]
MSPLTSNGDEGKLRTIAKSTPVPLAGLMLGMASTGNMVPEYRWFFGFFAFTIMFVLINKIVFDFKSIKEELKNPAIAGIACTFPMGVAVLSTYIKPYYPDLALGIWIGMLALHIALMLYFTRSYIIKFDLKKCLPCYFVVYVGFSVNAFIAPVYGQLLLGQILFWFGFISFLALLPPLLYRIVVIKSLAEPMIPTIVIFASPASVCLYAYLKAYPTPDTMMVYILLAFSVILYVATLSLLPRILKLKFYPSYSSLTFPLVISGIATNATFLYLSNNEKDLPGLQYLAYIEIALAVIVVLYVLSRYVHHFIMKRYMAESKAN